MMTTRTKTVIDPANEINLVWFKWTIPDNVPADQVSLKAVVNAPDTQYERETPKTFKKPSSPSSTLAQA